jgi:hypothetical protein
MTEQSAICQELAGLLPSGYSVLPGQNNSVSILSPGAIVKAQVEISTWALESETNLRTYLANLSNILLRYIQS